MLDSDKAFRLRGAREAQGKSLRQLEIETGLHRATISRIERGDLQPNVRHLIALGKALGIRDLVDVLERFQ